MRIDLRCPFQDKDQAKQLGARWDPKLRLWYVENASDLTPFARWLPAGQAGGAAVDAAGSNSAVRAQAASPVRTSHRPAQPGAVITGPDAVADCGCAALPWEPCDCAKPIDRGARNRGRTGTPLMQESGGF